MKFTTTRFSEHQTSSKQNLIALDNVGAQMMAPGACTSCNGSTSTSCCGMFSPNGAGFRGDEDEG